MWLICQPGSCLIYVGDIIRFRVSQKPDGAMTYLNQLHGRLNDDITLFGLVDQNSRYVVIFIRHTAG